MRKPWIGRSACAVAVASGLLAAPAAYAKTFIASPSIADTSEASACTSPCALRQAIAAAEVAEETAFNSFQSETQTIELPVGTYTLTKGPLRIEHKYASEPEDLTLTLRGLGAHASEVVITAEGRSRALVDGDLGGTSGQVVLERLEVTGGNGEGGIAEPNPNEPEKGEGGGIAIEQNGTLKLDEVLLTGNTAAVEGGGVEDIGELTVENSTIAHNTVTGGRGLGGGISSDNLNNESHESIEVVNSTIADNSVSGGSQNEGSAIFNGTVLELTNSTLSGNSAPGTGGALAGFKNGAAPKLGVSTLANNIIAYNAGKDCAGTAPTSKGGNDFDDESCEVKASAEVNKDILKNPELELENSAPRLEENGGPTPTIAFANASSPAVGAGLEVSCPAADQRGTARPAHADCSSGAYQYVTPNFEFGPPSNPPVGTVLVYFDSEAPGEGNGTKQAPFRSVRALEPLLERREEEIAHEHGEVSPLELLFAGGEYEGLEFTNAKEISVYGDLNPSTWRAEREPADPTRFAGQPQGLLLDGSTEMRFQQVVFQGRAAFSPGASAYGVRMIDGSHATFADVRVEAGAGADGARGATGAQGAAGTNGAHGNAGYTPGDVRGILAEHGFFGGEFYGGLTCPVAAANGIWSMSYEELEELYNDGNALCPNIPIAVVAGQKPERSPNPGNGGFGGRGGWLNGGPGGGQPGQKGNSTANAQGGAGGHEGVAQSTWCCENGKSATSPGGEGGAGSAGSLSVNAKGVASSYSNLYTPGHGGAGGEGEGGAGGGGGGGGSGDFDDLSNGGGDSGGSGGSGGYGGGGGSGGEAGGGSFALYVAPGSSAVVDYSGDLVTQGGGSGGQGGNGGAGGAGGQGSAYAATTIGAGSNGGAGGAGGPGGPGGGGEGGPSFAVAGGGSVELGTGVLEEVARPGEGGEPGGEGGRPARSGGGGPNEPCSSNCKVNPQLPVQLPSSVTVSKGVVVITIGCLEACTGKLTLTGNPFGNHHVKGLALAAKHGARSNGTAVLGRLSFSLRAKQIAKLRIHLGKAARKRLKGLGKGLPATLTVELKLRKAKRATRYTQQVELLPSMARKPAKAK